MAATEIIYCLNKQNEMQTMRKLQMLCVYYEFCYKYGLVSGGCIRYVGLLR